MSSPSLRPGHGVALCALALLCMGVLMVNSASMRVDAAEPMTVGSILQSKFAAYAGLAVLAMAAASMIPVRRVFPSIVKPAVDPGESVGLRHTVLTGPWFGQLFREYARMWPLWLGAGALVVVLLSVYVPGLERPKNGSHRWINLRLPGLDSMQPSEVAKWALIGLLAWYGARSAHRMKSFWLGLVPGLAAAGLVAGCVVVEDLGTGALMAAVAAVMLLAAGGRLWQMALLAPVPIMGAVVAIVTNPYRLHRIESFVNPYLDPQGKGFHMIQSMTAVAGGQVFGRGLGHGLQKFGYLPEDTTDFLFAIICEELGIAGAALVVGLLGLMLWCLWLIVRHERVIMLKLLGLGVLATIGIQAIINLAVVTGMGPTKGIALPLLSSGGTGWILTCAALGLVIAMDRAQAQEGARLLRGVGSRPGGDGSVAAGVIGAVAAGVSAAPSLASVNTGGAPSGAVAVAEVGASEDVASELVGASSALPPPLPPPVPSIEPMPVLEVTPGEQAAPEGFLFDVSKPKADSKVVVTDAGKGWPAAS